MAALALGVPVVTTDGHLTDAVWRRGAVALAPVGDPERLARICLDLLEDPERRLALGKRGGLLYAESFSLEHTIETLLAASSARVARTS